jgi:hypothetical protein
MAQTLVPRCGQTDKLLCCLSVFVSLLDWIGGSACLSVRMVFLGVEVGGVRVWFFWG